MTDLSRLLAGELPPEEAEALRARLAADPALRARWEHMCARPGRLAPLPKEAEAAPATPRRAATPAGAGATASTFPAGLPTHTRPPEPASPGPRAPTPSPAGRGPVGRLLLGAGWLAAAALALVLLRPGPTRVLTEGTERVDGHATVLAGTVRVEVEGVADVSVEPSGPGARESGHLEKPMATSHLLAGLGGALVTVTVLEGTAWIRGEGEAPLEVKAGETRSVGAGGAGGAGDGARPGAPPATNLGKDEQIAALTAELEKVKLERAMAVGQLRRVQGTPQEWPTEVPSLYKPDGFRQFLDGRVRGLPGAEVLATDCEEYPCIAIIRSNSDAPDWVKELDPLSKDLEAAGFGDSISVMGAASETRDDDGRGTRLYAWGVAPGERGSEVADRMNTRLQEALKDATDELATDAGGGAP